METYNWSDLNPGDVFGEDTLPGGFNPESDELIFDDPAFSAAQVLFDGNDVETFLSLDGKFVTLDTAPYTITTTNLTFADGSVLIIGDNTTGVADDDAANTITGGAGDDQLIGAGGNDTIDGAGGDDLITGGDGDDSIDGGADSDTLSFADSPDGVIVNMTGSQQTLLSVVLEARTASDGSGGTDSFVNVEHVRGSAFDDFVLGSSAANVIDGGAGDDILAGGGSMPGSGDNADDTLLGGAGDDQLRQTRGNDVIDGGAGQDTLIFRTGVDYGGLGIGVNVDLGAGTSDGDPTDALVADHGGNSTATVSNVEIVIGTDGDDTLIGGGLGIGRSGVFFEVFNGGAGDDTIDGVGANAQSSGFELNRVDYVDDPNAVNVNLATGVALDGHGGTDTLLNINWVRGSGFNDTLTGGNPSNDFFERFGGLAGNDVIDGGSGFDEVSYRDDPNAVNLDLESTLVVDGYGDTDTLSNIEGVEGSDFNDTLTGGTSGGEIFDGRGGNDTINGGAGPGTDFATYSTVPVANGGVDAFIETGLVSSVSDGWGTTDTLISIEGLIGSSSDDTLGGGVGNQTFFGRGGSDIISGGDDTDTVSYLQDPGAVNVNLDTGIAIDGFGALALGGTDTLSDIENVIGSEFGDTIVGDGNANLLDGRGGSDYIDGGAGNDTMIGSEGRDTVLGGAGNDLFNGSATVVNGLRTDALQSFEGGAGNDTLNGANGDGRATMAEYRGATARVIVNLGDPFNNQSTSIIVGADTVAAGTARDGMGGTDKLVNVDGVVGSMFNDVLVGGAFANSVGGNTLQFFEGLDGNDTITGGFDFGGAMVLYHDSPLAVNVNLGTGIALDGWGNTDTLFQIDHVRGSMHHDTLIGGSQDEEHFEGLGGNDRINGGDGFDNVHYSRAGEAVYVNFATGIGRGLSDSVTGGSLGNDTLTSIEAAHGTDFADSLVGGGLGAQPHPGETFEAWELAIFQGFEEFEGRAGNDTLNGGDASVNTFDLALYRNAPSAVIVNLGTDTVAGVGPNRAMDGYGVNGNPAGIDTLININGAEGSRFNDTLVGSAGRDYFIGRDGNDSIDGGGGIDYISYDSSNRVSLNLGAGTATEFSGGGFNSPVYTDTFTGIENALGSNGNDTIIGNGGANLLVGFEGNDLIAGDGTVGGGNDTLYGGEGDDILRQTRGNDYIDGGEGSNDRLEFNANGITYGGLTSVLVNLGAGTSDANRNTAGDIGTVTGVEVVHGTAGHDILTGGSLARSASDSFVENYRGNGGNDTIDGIGSGTGGRGFNDQVDYSNSTGGVNVNFATGVASDGFGGTDTLRNINWVGGSSANDVLTGSDNSGAGRHERFEGRAGSDTINGGGGGDEASYIRSPNAVNVNLGTGIAFDGWGFTDALFSIERVRGSDFDDILTGSNNLDVVEMFLGEEGDDTINGGAGIDFAAWRTTEIDEGGINVLLGTGTVEVDDGFGGTDTLINIEGLDGTNSGDTLGGGAGDQWFRGRGGSDSINGGAGIDTADYSSDHLSAIVNLGTTQVVVGSQTVAAGTARDGFGGVYGLQGTDKLVSIENVLGSSSNDHITGSSVANLLDGSIGNDTINGGLGNDTLVGGTGNDLLVGGAGNDTLDGGAGNDTLVGGDGDDRFVDKSGADNLSGGNGADTFIVDYTAGIINAAGGTGSDTYVLNPNALGSVYRVTDFDNTGTGANRDFIDVGGLLDASATAGYYTGQDPFATKFLRFFKSGNDKVLQWDISGGGNNYVDVLTLVGLGNATVNDDSFKGFVVGSAAANKLGGSTGDDVMLGLAGNDSLNGGVGNDQLFGGDGSDTMRGGAGDDTFEVDSAKDVVIEGADAPGGLLLPGTATAGPGAAALSGLGDTVIAAINFSLEKLQFVEHIQLTVSASRAIGNASANRLTGNAGNDSLVGAGGNDTLDGGVGSDTMDGGAGNDVFFVDSLTDVVKELATGGGTDTIHSLLTEKLANYVEHLVLLGGDAINGIGNTLHNSITGNSGKNALTGNAGNDTLNGGAGNDTLNGGAGNDLYFVDAAGDVVVSEATGSAGGIDTVQSSVTETLDVNVENLILTGNLAVNGTGNGLANSITGNGNDNRLDGGLLNDTLIGGTGNDTLIGGAGTDSMTGGAGDDIYIVDAADVVTEGANAGLDVMQTAVTRGALSANVENLMLTGNLAINGTGNGLDNTITGNTAANRLDGAAGNDTIAGGTGNDTLIGGAGNDTLVWDPLDGSIQGGTQTVRDTLRVDGTGVTIDLTSIIDTRITGVEIVDLTGSGNNTLTLGTVDVLAIGDSDELMVHGNAGDTVNQGAGWVQGVDLQMDGNTYRYYTQGLARLLVDADVTSVG